MTNNNKTSTSRASGKDLILPVAILSCIAMMMFPLPLVVVDILLMLSLTFSLVLIVSCAYLAEPEKYTSLPTIMLLGTLFRLGLNISTTRIILSTGQAPQIVVSFAHFVTNGNLVVGSVIFLIITLIQFLVIAKGAERVAEVAARFALDAMPGKQMAIDADVRAGVLGMSQAREKRLELQRESRLYGALDGAMKFIKGDCIAGLCIAVLNVSAGLVIGIVTHKLTFLQSLQRYTLYTIGDGLCAQLPALLVAVSAGIVVTRVAEKDGSLIGRDIFGQMTREPQAVAMTGLVLCLLAFVPGFPFWLFILGGMALLAVVMLLHCGRKLRGVDEGIIAFRPKLYGGLVVRLGPASVLKLQSEALLMGELQFWRERIYSQWGVLAPEVQFDLDNAVESEEFYIYLHGSMLQSLGPSQPARSLTELIVRRLDDCFLKHIHEFLNDTQARIILDLHAAESEDLINSVVPSVVTVTQLTQILRQLLYEGVPIREMSRILQAIAEYQLEVNQQALPGPTRDLASVELARKVRLLRQSQGIIEGPMELLATVRLALRQSIALNIANSGARITCYVLEANTDRMLAGMTITDNRITPESIERLNIEAEHLARHAAEKPVVIVTSCYARLVLSSILASKHWLIRVVSVEEMQGSLIPIDIVGTFGTSEDWSGSSRVEARSPIAGGSLESSEIMCSAN